MKLQRDCRCRRVGRRGSVCRRRSPTFPSGTCYVVCWRDLLKKKCDFNGFSSRYQFAFLQKAFRALFCFLGQLASVFSLFQFLPVLAVKIGLWQYQDKWLMSLGTYFILLCPVYHANKSTLCVSPPLLLPAQLEVRQIWSTTEWEICFLKATGICWCRRADLLKTKQNVSGGVVLLMGLWMISVVAAGRWGGADVTVGVHRIAWLDGL